MGSPGRGPGTGDKRSPPWCCGPQVSLRFLQQDRAAPVRALPPADAPGAYPRPLALTATPVHGEVRVGVLPPPPAA
jgi:hypothetical protein